MKTSELTGAALDWAVHIALHGVCEGYAEHQYSTNWAKGGPIIERERVHVYPIDENTWEADTLDYTQFGPTPLIAAMRCYVASQMGDEVEIPEELQ